MSFLPSSFTIELPTDIPPEPQRIHGETCQIFVFHWAESVHANSLQRNTLWHASEKPFVCFPPNHVYPKMCIQIPSYLVLISPLDQRTLLLSKPESLRWLFRRGASSPSMYGHCTTTVRHPCLRCDPLSSPPALQLCTGEKIPQSLNPNDSLTRPPTSGLDMHVSPMVPPPMYLGFMRSPSPAILGRCPVLHRPAICSRSNDWCHCECRASVRDPSTG